MRKPTIIQVIVLITFGLFLPHTINASYPDVAKGVMSRLLPAAVAEKFQFEEIPDASGLDVFEVQASGGVVTVKGNTAVSMCRGAYDYLKKDCNCIVNWDGNQLNVPDPLPNTANRRVVSKVKYRLSLQGCSFGYSSPYWDWEKWENELDWMALHGINMPMSHAGQEKALQNVLVSYGFTNSDILGNFFSSPAHLPWYRMGNLYAQSGPMPQSFVDFQCELQKKILARQMEMGMKPIVPGFSAFVPKSFTSKFPGVSTRVVEGFGQQTLQIHVGEPMFAEMMKKFIDEYKLLYGENAGYYSIDLYNEMTPPVGSNAVADLEEIGKEVHAALKAADPNGIWVMQGWMFSYKWPFWTETNINAWFRHIPLEEHITLDMGASNNRFVLWSESDALANRQLIWGHIMSFGGRNHFMGNMDWTASRAYTCFNNIGASKMVGMGLCTEATDNNQPMAELVTDMMWLQSAPDVEAWARKHGEQRYGTKSQSAGDIWAAIYKHPEMYSWTHENYDTYQTNYQRYLTVFPLLARWTGAKKDDMRDLVKMMLEKGNELNGAKLYQYDLIEVGRKYFGEMAGNSVKDAFENVGGNQQQHIDKYNKILLGVDSLLANIPIYRLDTWINDARSIVPAADKDYMEKNAREIISYWWFCDYARREWAGMVKNYYMQKWNKYFESGQSGTDNVHNTWLTKTLEPSKECLVHKKVAELLLLTDNISVDPVTILADEINPINSGSFITKFGSGYFNIITAPECNYEITLYSLKGSQYQKIQGKGNRIFRTDRLGVAPGLLIVQVKSINTSRTFKVHIQ